MAWSPVKSALSSYPGSPKDLPKVFFKILKSLTLMTLSLLQSPALIITISTGTVRTLERWNVGTLTEVTFQRSNVPTFNCTVPELARYLGSFARQLYVPVGRPDRLTVKKPLA